MAIENHHINVKQYGGENNQRISSAASNENDVISINGGNINGNNGVIYQQRSNSNISAA